MHLPLLRHRRAQMCLMVTALALLFALACLPPTARAQGTEPPESDMGNPTGNAGGFNGSVTTGGSYDPFTGNATRTITDLVVPGSVGAYPLQFSRTTNSRYVYGGVYWFSNPGSWRHSYQYELRKEYGGTGQNGVYTLHYPDGRKVEFHRLPTTGPFSQLSNGDQLSYGPPGTADRFRSSDLVLLLADGGEIQFEDYNHPYPGLDVIDYRARRITDPYKKITALDYYGLTNRVYRVTEPGGRCIQLNYGTVGGGSTLYILSVQSFIKFDGQNWTGQTVTYGYGVMPANLGGWVMLLGAGYDAEPKSGYPHGVPASYGYATDGSGGLPLLNSLDDPHHAGAMPKIKYDLDTNALSGTWGQIARERNADTNEIISALTFTGADETGGTTRRETRGDGPGNVGPSRSFGYFTTSGTSLYKNFLRYVTDFTNGIRSYRSYDAYAYLSGVQDRRGNWTTFVNEPYTGKPTQITMPADDHNVQHVKTITYTNPIYPYYIYSTTVQQTVGQALTTTYYRDGMNRVYWIAYPDGGYETFSYDDNPSSGCGQVYQHRLVSGGTVTNHYGARGLLTSQDTVNNAGWGTTVWFGYDALDRLASVTDANGNQTLYAYNGRHQVTSVTHPQDPGASSRPSSYGTLRNYVSSTYDDYGNQTSVTDESSRTTTTAYDGFRRPTQVTDGGGLFTQFRYHPRNPADGSVASNETTTTRVAWSGVMQPSYNNGSTLYKHAIRAFDPDGRLATAIEGLGGTNADWPNVYADPSTTLPARFAYDLDGNLLNTTDPSGRVAAFTYDKRGRRTSQTLPDVSYGRTYFYDYDGMGNLLSEKRPGNTVTLYSYDEMNRRWRTQEPNGAVTRTVFDYENGPAGVGTKITFYDPNNNSYVTHFDGLGRKTRLEYPAGNPETWSYNAVGNLATFTNRAIQTKTFTYNNRNLVETTFWSPAGVGQSTETYYFAEGRPWWLKNNTAVVSYQYDASGRRTHEWQDAGTPTENYAVVSGYDWDHTRTTIAYPSNMTASGPSCVTVNYSNRRQTGGIWWNGVWQAGYGYWYDGTLSGRGLANNTQTWYNVNWASQLDKVYHYRNNDINNNMVTERDYGYDALERRVWMQKREDGLGEHFWYDNAGSASFGFDDRLALWYGQMTQPLSSTNPPAGSAVFGSSYALDLAGNRTGLNYTSGTPTTYVPDALNRYATLNNQQVGYDGNGNLISDPLTGSSYTYDADGQLLSATPVGGGTLIQFGYDALGRSVYKQQGTIRTRRYYDGANLIEKRDQASNWGEKHIFMPGAVDMPMVMILPAGTKYYYHQDAQGNVVALTNSDSTIKERYLYDAFGKPYVYDAAGNYVGQSAPSGNKWMFTGREYLPPLGLYDYRARMYSPTLGRFLQSDPIGHAGGNHLYRYCGNDPGNRTDPSGLYTENEENPKTTTQNEQKQTYTGSLIPRDIGSASGIAGFSFTPNFDLGLGGGMAASGVQGGGASGFWLNTGYIASNGYPVVSATWVNTSVVLSYITLRYTNGTRVRTSAANQFVDLLRSAAPGSLAGMEIAGHGTPDNQGFSLNDPKKDKSGIYATGFGAKIMDADGKEIDKLNAFSDRFAAGADIFLDGCNCAQGENNVTRQVSIAVPGARVFGSPNYVSAYWFNEGIPIFWGGRRMYVSGREIPPPWWR